MHISIYCSVSSPVTLHSGSNSAPDLYSGMSNPSCSLIDAQFSVQIDIPQQFSRRRNEWHTWQAHFSLSAQDPPFIHNRSLPLACSNYRECRKIYQVKNYASDLFYLFFGMKRSAFPKVEPVLMGLLLGMPEAFEERSLLRLIIVSILIIIFIRSSYVIVEEAQLASSKWYIWQGDLFDFLTSEFHATEFGTERFFMEGRIFPKYFGIFG